MHLSQAVAEQPALVEPYLGTVVSDHEKFASANAARWVDGVLLHVPAGVEISTPLPRAACRSTPRKPQRAINPQRQRYLRHQARIPSVAFMMGVLNTVGVGLEAPRELATEAARHLGRLGRFQASDRFEL